MVILSIDDSWTIRNAVKMIVEVLNVDFREAENGREGLNLLREGGLRPDLILLDWEMPVMTGIDFLEEIERDAILAKIPIIMLTTVSQKESMIRAIRAGAKQYITKPFTSEELLTKILQVVDIEMPGLE